MKKNKVSPKVAFVGLSHLGLVTSCCWTTIDKPILGIDPATQHINNLKNGLVTINEPGLQKLFNQIKKDYLPSTDFSLLKTAKFVFISQDTPIEESGKSSTKELDLLIDMTLPHLRAGTTIILMSQVPVGYCRNLENRIKEKYSKMSFVIIYWVETIVMTNAIDRVLHPERVILGFSQKDKNLPIPLINKAKKFECPIITMSYESAEITKAAINLYLATSVAFANTLADYCEAFGANINEIIPALRTDKRIGPYAYLRPGLRISGGHLERDLVMYKRLSKSKGANPGIVDYILRMNKSRYRWVINKTENLFKKYKYPTIGIWGLAYKKNSNSTHNAASIKILQELKGKAKFIVYDPEAKINSQKYSVEQVANKFDATKDVDCLIILTEWDEFRTINIRQFNQKFKGKLVIDAVGIFSNNVHAQTTYTYVGLGIGNNLKGALVD